MCYCALIPCTDGIFENQRFIDWKCLQVQIEFYRDFRIKLGYIMIVSDTEMPSLQLIKHPRQSQVIATNSKLLKKFLMFM